MAAKYGIKSIPTMLIFNKGDLKNQLVGSMPKKNIEDAAKDLINIFQSNELVNPMENDQYYNIKKMKKINLC